MNRRERITRVVLYVLIIPSLVAMLLLCGRLSGGRFGIIGVDGDSMLEFPNRSYVMIWLGKPAPGGFVCAWAALPRGAGKFNEKSEPEDDEPCLVVKKYLGNKLISTASRQEVGKFELRGRVVAYWNPPWNHSGAAAADPKVAGSFPNEQDKRLLRSKDRVVAEIKDKRVAWIKGHCDPIDFAMPDPSIREWKHTFQRPIYMVEVNAETPYVLAMLSNGLPVKDAGVCAPPTGKLTLLFTTRESPLKGEVTLQFQEAESPPPATKLHHVRVWVAR